MEVDRTEARHVKLQGLPPCYRRVNVNFNGILESAGAVKILVFNGFLRRKSEGGKFHFRHARTLKFDGRRIRTDCFKRNRCSRHELMERRNTNFKFLSLLKDC